MILARHAAHCDLGQVLTGRRGGAPLSDSGRAQAERLAQRLAREEIDVVHSSPQERARETAEIVAGRLGIDVEVAPALDEIDFGEWTGRTFEGLACDPRWMRWNERRSEACPPGGEPMAAAVARAVAHLELIGFRDRRRLLCISHADIIRGVVAHYLGLSFDNLLRFDIDAASISSLVMEGGGVRLKSLNERCAA